MEGGVLGFEAGFEVGGAGDRFASRPFLRKTDEVLEGGLPGGK